MVERRAAEQMRSEMTATAVGPKQFFGMRALSDTRLCALDFAFCVSAVGPVAQRNGVRKRVVADPMAGRTGLLHHEGRRGVVEIPSDHEERRGNLRLSQDVEHALGDTGRRPVVKAERDPSDTHMTYPTFSEATAIRVTVALGMQKSYRITRRRIPSDHKGNRAGQSVWGIVNMRTRQTPRFPARAALVLLSLGFLAAPALSAERSAGQGLSDELTRQEIAEWHDKLYQSTNALNAPGGGSSGLRGWAMMALAMYEASNTIDRAYSAYAVQAASVPAAIDLKMASRRVAVAKAAQTVLDGLFAPPPSQPTSTLAHLRRFAHASEFAIHTAALDPTSPAYINGVALGRFIGEQILKKRADDGHPAADTKVVNGTRWNEYQYGLNYFPNEPQASGYINVRPFGVAAFGLAGGAVTFVVPPLAAESAEFKTQWDELYRYGTSDPARSARTAETDATARFHDGNFGSQIGNTIDILASADIGESGTDLLRIIALTAMSAHDAHANHWFWKYHYRFGRPITQYRQVPSDAPNGLGALHDDAWQPVLTTSQNPEYPSGHAARTGALTASFRKAFGDKLTFRTISFSDPSAPARTYTSFTAFQDEVMISRTYGGVHWRHSGPAGRDMAERVTDYIWSHYLLEVTAANGR